MNKLLSSIIGSILILLFTVCILLNSFDYNSYQINNWAETNDFFNYNLNEFDNFNELENSHMQDVRDLFLIFYIVLFICIISLFFIDVNLNYSFYILFFLFIICIFFALIDFNLFFDIIHKPFFKDNYSFSSDSNIKIAYPNEYFINFGISVVVFIILFFIILKLIKKLSTLN
ncbi:DUF1461 domain-containing protein [Candidatus Woesearchaeota archaeon]|jgi:hypothetical protein|nr:DUF1461 domain-containing protein [Candidatus Woesearchaeota archaeon]MBT4388060.1 DUF1461 domain-containing protein [Candidatus Woesearchaeota archaeon]MBT4596325.1 DUF1461 domain-containing protein [Candidatus Woesearchaeota archaeon]MBT5740827.1 DUF1461 domain-containing protein [Candidatus Woesearchaeota archaeon]MBT7848988.1 DUF1461 domain-containing protein [Candidatus Woesearchaeota archaeon]